MRRSIIISVFLIVFTPSAAFAADLGLFAGASYANLNTLRAGGLGGPGVQLGTQLQFADYWGVSADVGASYHFENTEDELPADTVMSAAFQLKYYVDVFTYVPYFALGPAFYLDVPAVSDAALTNFGAKFSVGVDYRFSRSWSVGFQGDLHALATDLGRYPVYTNVGLRVVWHLRL